jgi:hypothetical protein
MTTHDRPNRDGPWWFKTWDALEWTEVQVDMESNTVTWASRVFPISSFCDHWPGQWMPIPTPEELTAKDEAFGAMLAELRRQEWRNKHLTYELCPTCGGANPAVCEGIARAFVGHAPDCTLAAALALASAPPEAATENQSHE